jgi:exonuclease III
MRLITLNTWSGRSMYPLMKFLRQQSKKTDIFCLQEVIDCDQQINDQRRPGLYCRGDLFQEISLALPNFRGYIVDYPGDPARLCPAMFVRRSLTVKVYGEAVVHSPTPVPPSSNVVPIDSRIMQCIIVDYQGQTVLVANYHGLWQDGHKSDTTERLNQSYRIRDFLCVNAANQKILCGDFNLLPDTISMKILEADLCNLITDFGVTGTRTPLYRNFDDPSEPNFADYILVSRSVRVKRFAVMPDLVSDHAPLRLAI